MRTKTQHHVLTCLDLFCGAGGMSLGFKQAGIAPIFALDNDRHSIDSYKLNFGDHAICANIQDIASFPRADVVIGGPPCQGFSRLGKQTHGRPTEKSYHGNGLWVEFMRCVREVRPKAFIIENVPDFFKHFAWEGIAKDARELGYLVASAVLNAADYGVPQRRARAIIIGCRVARPIMPAPSHQSPGSSLFGLPPWRTVRDAIGDLPLEPDGHNRHDRRNVSALALLRYKAIPPGGNRKNIPDEIQLACWKHKDPRSGGSADLMGRLVWDAPALTIRTQFLKPEKGRYLHPEAHRSITVREGARLQTFPDEFKFAGSNFQAVRQIGNAVPVLLARRIAETVKVLVSAKPKIDRSAA